MSLLKCPRCQVQVTVANNSGDYVHECNSGNPTLDQEDVKVVGNWEDYTGSATVESPQVRMHNLGNKLQGTDAWVREDARDVPRSERGANKQIFRQRQHLEYIENPHQPMG